MRDQVRFRTSLFPPPIEQSENGLQLAEWVCSKLPSRLKADFIDEDWGCRVMFGAEGFAQISLACGHVEENQWSIACFVERSFIDKLLKRPEPTEALKEIIQAIDAAVAKEGQFSNVEWFENDRSLNETNYGARAFDE